jgi:Putative transmembrane protein (PGPGW)
VDGLWRILCFIARSTRRLAILVAGLAVVAVGIVLIPAPGPGWLVVFAGLAILATEFTWAEMLLERAKRQAMRAKDAAVRSVNGRRRPPTTNGSAGAELPADARGAAAPSDAPVPAETPSSTLHPRH